MVQNDVKLHILLKIVKSRHPGRRAGDQFDYRWPCLGIKTHLFLWHCFVALYKCFRNEVINWKSSGGKKGACIVCMIFFSGFAFSNSYITVIHLCVYWACLFVCACVSVSSLHRVARTQPCVCVCVCVLVPVSVSVDGGGEGGLCVPRSTIPCGALSSGGLLLSFLAKI